MCGIAASLPADPEFVAAALKRLVTRGPDQTASVDLEFCSLGVNRLAISGLADGDQPFIAENDSVTVVFNGAIYNTEQLIEEFDLNPRSSNDGEVIAPLYQRLGLGFADHLEGMFAICIADSQRRELVVAVDQIGIKPLYWVQANGHWQVASTVDAFPHDVRHAVRRVPPDAVWTSSGRVHRIVHRTGEHGSLAELLRTSVRQQIPREVPWGSMLSGGVDSSLIAALAAEHASEVHTFTCGAAGATDLVAAREVAAMLGTTHHELIVDPAELPDLVDHVVTATASFERWTVMAGVGTYLVARFAREQGVKVLLSGEGADELFGGYDEFQAVPAPYLNGMMLQYQYDLGVSECLRLDRCTMAYGVEARVPFLSTPIMRHARALPPSSKIGRIDGKPTRKIALRRVAEEVLSRQVAYRAKEEFTNGSGLTGQLRLIAERQYPDERVKRLAGEAPGFRVTEPLSAWFYDRWRAIYGDSIGADIESLVARGLLRQPWNYYQAARGDFAVYHDRLPD